MDVSKISWNEYVDEFHIGRLIIRGLDLKLSQSDNPLVVIWTTIRKRVFDKVGLSVVGYFDPDRENPGTIKGKFYLAYPEGVDIDEHFAKFAHSFHREMDYFEKVVERFLTDPRGYDAYMAIKAKLADEPAEVRNAAAKAEIQTFLKAIKVRKKND